MNNILLSELNQANICEFLKKLSVREDIPNVHLTDIDTNELTRTMHLCPQTSFFIVNNDEPVGVVLTSIRHIHAEILLIYISPRFRRCGLGSHSIAAAFSLLSAKNVKTVSLEVLSDNTPAIRLYNKLGFTKNGTIVTLRNEKNSFYRIMPNISVRPAQSLLVLPTIRMFTKNSSFRRDLFKDSNALSDLIDVKKAQFVTVLENERAVGYIIYRAENKILHIYHYGFDSPNTEYLFAAMSAIIKEETITQLQISGDDTAQIEAFCRAGFYKDMTQEIYVKEISPLRSK